jgi:ketosteroid isomerase-like protein
MSAKNVEIVKESFEAYEQGGLDSLADRLAPEFEIGDRVVPEGSPAVKGPEALARTLAELRDAFGEMRFRALEFLGLGERVLVRVRIEGRADLGELAIEEDIAHLYTLRDGLIAKLDIYRTWPEGRKAAGLER